jgi:hypothetical protein
MTEPIIESEVFVDPLDGALRCTRCGWVLRYSPFNATIQKFPIDRNSVCRVFALHTEFELCANSMKTFEITLPVRLAESKEVV